ncbi:MT-A70 family methyltransferase [Tabrizicola fusiformis]|uniref:MT-A70 family methyltransferase n=1 Tax=Tabrizicola sp. SY72 TaxID=2741673 RepID=UPI001F508FDE|nr:MT-A70 family methyltransferase [Tabrizicola sp. SY72]
MLAEFHALRPVGGFGLIMADPPWAYDMRSEKGYAKSPEAHYGTMPLSWIKALPVEALAAADCLLWLWHPASMTPDALEVIGAWGFRFKTGGHWAKVGASGKQAFGTGYILRNAGEPWMIATRGAPRTTKAVRSVIIAPAREHSRKPDEAYADAERLMPNVQRLDLFSRQRRPGWASWGNEVDKFGPRA